MATKQPDQRRRDGANRDGIAGDENDRQYPHTCKRDCGCGEIYLTRHTDDDGELTDEFAVVWRGQRLGRFGTANSASAVRDQLAK